MGFFGKDNLTDAESGNWNSAEDFSKAKITSILILCDEYEELAEFGSLNLYDEIHNKGFAEELKLRGFRRLINHLIRVCNNSWFALEKHPSSQKKIEEFKKELKEIGGNLPSYISVITNDVKKTRELILTQDYYTKLERVSEIKKEINLSLNEGDLIFIHKDSFDAKDYKKKIFDDAIERG